MKNFDYLCDFLGALPGVTQDVKWGAARVFSVGEKMIAVTRIEAATDFAFKVDDERFLELTDRPGIIPAPYMARMKWIQLEHAGVIKADEARALVQRAYDIIFSKLSKKLQQEIRNG